MAAKSTEGQAGGGGPRTPSGKMRSRGNARKHGVFSSELTLSSSEKLELNELRAGLDAGRKHDDPIADLLFDDFLTHTWLLKKATRHFDSVANAAFQDSAGDSAGDISASSKLKYPYVSNKIEIRQRLKLLDSLRAHCASSGSLSQYWMEILPQAFGATFLQILNEWAPPHIELIHFAEVALERATVYGTSSMPEGPTPEKAAGYKAADSYSRHQMTLKLIDLQAEHLRLELHRAEAASPDGFGAGTNGRLDLALRYLTTARRGFYRALHEYRCGGKPDSDPD